MANSKSSPYIIGLGLIILAIAAYIFGIQPMWTEVDSLKTQKETTINKKNTLQEQLNQYKKLEKELKAISEVKKETGTNAIPKKYNQDLLITTLVAKAEEHKMVINSISFGQGTETDLGINVASITTSIQGDYQRLVDFLRSLENEIQRKVSVKSISVELGESLGSLQTINFTLTMEVYYQSEI